MRITLIAIAVALAAAAPVLAKPNVSAEDKLAKALEGRVPGKPVDCIRQSDIDSSRIFDRTAILYEMRGGDYYLQRPRGGAQSLRWSVILVTNTHSPDLCSIDVIHLLDQTSRFETGFLNLDKFVPYRRPDRH